MHTDVDAPFYGKIFDILQKWEIKNTAMSIDKQHWFDSLFMFITKKLSRYQVLYNIKKNAAIDIFLLSPPAHTWHLLIFVQARKTTKV